MSGDRLVREHLKPGEFYKKREEVGDGAFRRLARKCELHLLYRVAKADSLGRNAEWVPREKWYNSEAQEWFLQRAKELEVEQQPPGPLLLGRHLLEMGLVPGPKVASTRVFMKCNTPRQHSDDEKRPRKKLSGADERGERGSGGTTQNNRSPSLSVRCFSSDPRHRR